MLRKRGRRGEDRKVEMRIQEQQDMRIVERRKWLRGRDERVLTGIGMRAGEGRRGKAREGAGRELSEGTLGKVREGEGRRGKARKRAGRRWKGRF